MSEDADEADDGASTLDDGDEVEVQGSSSTYTLSRNGDVYIGESHTDVTDPNLVGRISVFDRTGRNIYSFNDFSNDQPRLDLVLATADEAATLVATPPPSLAAATIATLTSDVGLVVLRVFVPDAASAPAARAALAAANCSAAF